MSLKFSIEFLKDHPADMQFYTGMLSYGLFEPLEVLGSRGRWEKRQVWATTYSEKTTNAGINLLLSSKEQLSLVLVHLHLGLYERDLAYRFKVFVATVSKPGSTIPLCTLAS